MFTDIVSSFPSSQVLQQINVFASDDVDSAAEALNDVSLTEHNLTIELGEYFDDDVQEHPCSSYHLALLIKLDTEKYDLILVVLFWFDVYSRCPSRSCTWLSKWLLRENMVEVLKLFILAKKRSIFHTSTSAFRI